MSDSFILKAKLREDLAKKHTQSEVAKAIYESAANAALLALGVDVAANDVNLNLDTGVVTVTEKPVPAQPQEVA